MYLYYVEANFLLIFSLPQLIGTHGLTCLSIGHGEPIRIIRLFYATLLHAALLSNLDSIYVDCT
jgi:hypothetical protein